MADAELGKLLQEHGGELKEMAQQLTSGEHTKLAGSAAVLVGALATGPPEVALLAPFAQAAVAKVFGSAADKALRREIDAYEKEEEKRAFARQIGEVVEVLLGEAILQIVRVQHRVKEEEVEAIEEALGGVRKDLAAFREELRAGLEGAGEAAEALVRVSRQTVREGAIGVRVGANARKRVLIANMDVSGKGSVGIDLG
jgi:hypothetical protein